MAAEVPRKKHSVYCKFKCALLQTGSKENRGKDVGTSGKKKVLECDAGDPGGEKQPGRTELPIDECSSKNDPIDAVYSPVPSEEQDQHKKKTAFCPSECSCQVYRVIRGLEAKVEAQRAAFECLERGLETSEWLVELSRSEEELVGPGGSAALARTGSPIAGLLVQELRSRKRDLAELSRRWECYMKELEEPIGDLVCTQVGKARELLESAESNVRGGHGNKPDAAAESDKTKKKKNKKQNAKSEDSVKDEDEEGNARRFVERSRERCEKLKETFDLLAASDDPTTNGDVCTLMANRELADCLDRDRELDRVALKLAAKALLCLERDLLAAKPVSKADDEDERELAEALAKCDWADNNQKSK